MSRIDSQGRAYVVTDPAHPVHGLVALDPDGNPVTLAVDADNRLKVDASVSVDAITIGDIEIKNDAGNPVPVSSGGAKATASISRVSASATSVTLLAANANRRRVIIHNESTASLRIKLGATASATSYSLLLGPGDTYESPTDWVYTGAVDGIWDAANGAAQITEV